MRRYLQKDPDAPSQPPDGCRDNPCDKWGLGAGRHCGLSQLGKENWQPGEDQQWPSFPQSPGLWAPSCHPAFQRVFQKTVVLNSINQILSPNFKSNVKPELITVPRVQWPRKKKPGQTHREYNLSLNPQHGAAPFKDSRVGGEANIPSVPAYHGHTPALGHQEDSHMLTGQREVPRPQDLRLLLTPGCCFDNSFFYETFVINKL